MTVREKDRASIRDPKQNEEELKENEEELQGKQEQQSITAAEDVFRTMSIPRAIANNAIPAILAMLMVLIYNVADTFFIGQTHKALEVSAISLATPVFLFFMAVGTIFGIGGTSVISRALGEGRRDYARRVSAFCMWACVVVGIVMAACFLIFMDPILKLIGASSATWDMTKNYLTIVSFCGPFVLISNCYNNVIRAEGKSRQAMMGQLIGNLLNVILDPIFILLLHLDVTGAAVATVIGNIVGALYYILYFLTGKSSLSVNIRDVQIRDHVLSGVLSIGIPAAIGSLLMSVSQIVVNARMAAYGDLAVAGIGVAMKVTMITGMICIGFGQGVQPLFGYCTGARLWDRFKKSMRYSVIISFLMSAAMTILCYVFINQIVGAFLTNQEALNYGIRFSKIFLTTSFLFGLYYVYLNAIQAMGASGSALIINSSRQGIIYIPALFLLESVMGVYGLVWAQPVADVLSTLLVIFLYRRALRDVMGKSKKAEAAPEVSAA
ncbi:MAG: MATE family efflux transporter [Anaerovoracaceae bacterium]|jgi:multidrug efflux pump